MDIADKWHSEQNETVHVYINNRLFKFIFIKPTAYRNLLEHVMHYNVCTSTCTCVTRFQFGIRSLLKNETCMIFIQKE